MTCFKTLFLAACAFALPTFASAAPPLDLEQAVALALAADEPALGRFEARARALEDEAVARRQLPDPMMTAQIANVPIDDFRFDQDGMTQALRVGLRQEFPAGKTLRIRGDQRDAEAELAQHRRRLAARDLLLDVRQAWLNAAWHEHAVRILDASRDAVANQIDSLSARFATGRMHAQDMLRAELELALLDDQRTEHRRQAESARSMLARYLGTAAYRPLGTAEIPSALAPVGTLEQRLAEHPAVAAEQARIATADLGVALAEQAYRPRFALEGAYGLRSDRADLASIGVSLSLPIFTDKRQDRQRSAAIETRSAHELDRDLLLRDLRRQLEQERVHWRRLNQRLELYRGVLADRARQTAEAAVTTYANGQTDFAELIRARLAELRADLTRAELENELRLTWARLVWLTGDPA